MAAPARPLRWLRFSCFTTYCLPAAPVNRSLRPVSCQKTRLRPLQTRPPLTAQQQAVHAHIANHHLQALLERLADDFAGFHIAVLRERNTVGERPSVTL